MLTIPQATNLPGFWKAFESLESERPRLLADAVSLAEIASPTGLEGPRAERVRDLLTDALGEASLDKAGNVRARLPGRKDAPSLMLLAPLDSSYPEGTIPVVDVRPNRLSGKGIATHAIALASLASLARTLRRHPVQGLGDIWFVATVGSEMAGDLRGTCNLFPWLPTVARQVLCLQGPGLGRLDHWSVGTYRGELTVWSPGGHCWRDAGRPNALRLAMEFSQAMEAVPGTGFPRSMYNPSRLESGDAWNTLPSRATLRFEFRSDGEAELQRMIRSAQAHATQLCQGLPGTRCELRQRGFRHATGLFPDHPMVTATREVQGWAGLTPRLGASSSDASVCLHYGVAAVTIGLSETVGEGTGMETIELSSLDQGLRQALAATVVLSGGVS
ncbi:MAG: peptidase dimerization domain-containing protein [Fibrobacteria bacterium]|nr:peptidase dimerization domain-containing protein [Fibrobacteria bacterium]